MCTVFAIHFCIPFQPLLNIMCPDQIIAFSNYVRNWLQLYKIGKFLQNLTKFHKNIELYEGYN
jgi:hypothetical protein